jgi:hypothetical protein
MDIKKLNKICFTICIVCIITGIVLGLALIWGSHDSEVLWKGLGTVLVLFFGSALTLSVSNAFSKKSGSKSSDDNDA